ncbi:MAG TPA: hypothetical protein VF234_07655 [Limnochordia bacterium]
MIGQNVSRWTISYFTVALGAFIAAQAIMMCGGSYPVVHFSLPSTLVTVHLLTIGWMSLLMIGALHQFVPVITGGGAVGDQGALFSLLTVPAGLSLMLVGFWGLGEGSLFRWCLQAGGAAVCVGVGVAIAGMGRTLWRARPLPLPARFVAAALAYLGATVAVGLVLAITITTSGLVPGGFAARIVQTGLVIHLASGIAGWFTLTAMGVAYKLMAMFTLAPEERGLVGRLTLLLGACGPLVVWLAGLLEIVTGLRWHALMWIGAAGFGLALLLYLYDMRLLFSQRKRRRLELNASAAAASLGALGVILLLALVTAVARPDWMPALVYLYLFGWLSGLGLSQLYKIVPFLTWLQHYGSRIGRGTVPRVQELVDEARARPWFIAYFVGVAAAAAAALTGVGLLFQAASSLTLLATLVIGRELWRARTGYYVPQGQKGDLP